MHYTMHYTLNNQSVLDLRYNYSRIDTDQCQMTMIGWCIHEMIKSAMHMIMYVLICAMCTAYACNMNTSVVPKTLQSNLTK